MSGEPSRHRGKGGKVFPAGQSYNNEGFEMENQDEEKDNRKVINKLKAIARVQGHMALPENALNIIANVKSGVGNWRKYSNKKRLCDNQGDFGTDRRKTGGSGLDYELSNKKAFDEADGTPVSSTMKQNVVAQNRNLIEYFAALAQPDNDDDSLNFEYILLLLKNGAKIDCTDKYGQTVLHEAARAWHVDVAKFLIEQGAMVSQGDNYGRTPLHVAAAVDYPEMVNFLITAKADKEAITKGEHQTPVHFAARNDACGSLKALIRAGCEYKLVRDYKGRTPLHVAAELDRSESARLLMELDDPAPAGVVDNSGQSAVVWMITKMPPAAKLALDQFHNTDRANRKQYYHLTCLEPRKPDDTRPVYPQQALQVLVRYRRLELVLHPVVLKLIHMKWKKFGRRGALFNTFLNFVFIMLWTLQGILVNSEDRHTYILPQDWWRIILFISALIVTIWQVKEELSEFYYSKKVHNNWKDWREGEIDRDVNHAHPRWPEEEQYLQQENDNLDEQKPQYFNDFWNIFDWICYALLIVVIVSHIVDVIHHTVMAARIHNRVMAFNIILIWLRLMKNVRAFSRLGPFIVMISHMIRDIMTFVILYILFYIPFFCAFWMLFGGARIPENMQGYPGAENFTMTVEGFEDVRASLFTLFRMTLVDEYPYGDLKLVDSIMTDLLVVAWLSISAIVMINLLIALMSDTFQRVYDNAQANAVMQKAITILNIEEGLSSKRRRKFREFLHSQCNPYMDFYDDDTTEPGGEDLKKVTIQIKEQLDEMQESMDDFISSSRREHKRSVKAGGSNENSSAVDSDKFDMEMNMVRTEMQVVLEKQRDMNHRMKKEMSIIKQLLVQIINSGSSGGTGINLSELESSPTHGGAEAPRRALGETFGDDEWERADKKRKKELKKLRKDLEKERLTQIPEDLRRNLDTALKTKD